MNQRFVWLKRWMSGQGRVLLIATVLSEAVAGGGGSRIFAADGAEVELARASIELPKFGPVQDITFDDLKLEIKKEVPYRASLLTKQVRQLKGQPVRIAGYMFPGAQQKGITQFVLTRKVGGCTSGGEELDDLIVVEMTPPYTAEFKVHPMDVEGYFSLRELKGPDGKILAIYHLMGMKVQKHEKRE